MPSIARDWWGTTHQYQLNLINTWISYMSEEIKDSEGKLVRRYVVWKIDPASFSTLMELYTTARAAYERAVNSDTAGKPATAACADAFENLERYSRDFRRRWFHIPPLTREDIAALGLREPNWGAGPAGEPTAEIQIVGSIKNAGYGQLSTGIEAVSGDLSARNNQGFYHTKYALFGPNDPPPKSYKELYEDIYTKKKKKVITFTDPDASGKIAYFCSRIERGDSYGRWGPITSAKVP